MRRLLALAVLVAVVGCSSADTSSSILQPGSVAIFRDEEPGDHYVKSGDELISLPQGTKFRVVRDGLVSARDVPETECLILEGQHQGRSARVIRTMLFPIKD